MNKLTLCVLCQNTVEVIFFLLWVPYLEAHNAHQVLSDGNFDHLVKVFLVSPLYYYWPSLLQIISCL